MAVKLFKGRRKSLGGLSKVGIVIIGAVLLLVYAAAHASAQDHAAVAQQVQAGPLVSQNDGVPGRKAGHTRHAAGDRSRVRASLGW